MIPAGTELAGIAAMGAVWLAAALAMGALGMTLLNRLIWPRGRADGRFGGRISVLIPARNEGARAASCVRAALASTHPVHEVRVYDDRSSDDTARQVAALAETDDRVRLLSGVALPAGWVGKPHACHRLAKAATGDLLIFVDADTTLSPEGLARIAALLQDLDADLVTAVPRQRTGSPFEHLLLPLLHLTYVSWLPLALIHRTRHPAVLAANGQVLAITRAAYERIGGFAAVRGEVVDDMALCRQAKRAGLRVVFADGHHVASCRMYRSARQVWSGFSKNVYEGLGHPVLLGGVIGVYLLAFVLPWIALPLSPWVEGLALPGAIGVGANLTQRGMLAARHGHRWGWVVWQPVAVLALVAIALNSWRWSRAGTIRWAGRTYQARSARVRS